MAHDLQGAQWRKSSFSGDAGQCVEVASNVPGLIGVRDSKLPSNPVVTVSPGEWTVFLTGLKHDVISI
ncbi:hypothetical protein Skr01_17840 [Sphaerisporangium krabiense]|uniref:DUF397 domain-containing protein n=1 Tax=Sphaerisporangium krabiense TaxID=763782 RepID=UPI00161BFEEC|nr:DUF397 domain-containing protein [Sphaerisporangium krabiense]GII61699.1 hypothetical protein Skr01_17840 [Sphaerisporangium krabiense]